MNVFITGGTTGIGREVGVLFARKGSTIGVCSFQDAAEVGVLPEGFLYFKADVTDEKAVESAVSEFVKKTGKLDLMIANAGINMPKARVPDVRLGKRVTQVNVFGVIHAFQAALPYFLEQGSGHFVALSSLSALNGLPGLSYYGASKAFVGNFCESLAVDLKDKNIDVTCIYPGFIATDLTRGNHHPMPFLLSVDQAAKKIMRTIERKKAVAYFPIVPFLFMSIVRRLPKWIYYPLMRRDVLNLRS